MLQLQKLCPLAMTMITACLLTHSLTQAAETCVICSEPAATYVCQPSAAAEHQIFLTNKRLIQFACIKNIAKTYGHGSCKADQTTTKTCSGKVISLDLSQMARDYVNRIPASLRPKLTAKTEPATAAPATPAAPTGEPKTVVELAKRTVENSQEQLKKTGEAIQNAGEFVGNSAKQTWQCLTTFFQKC